MQSSLIADTDKCIIDSKAIVLFAAAEILANQKVRGAQPLKLTKAQKYLRRLLAEQRRRQTRQLQHGRQRHAGGVDHLGAASVPQCAAGHRLHPVVR